MVSATIVRPSIPATESIQRSITPRGAKRGRADRQAPERGACAKSCAPRSLGLLQKRQPRTPQLTATSAVRFVAEPPLAVMRMTSRVVEVWRALFVVRSWF